MYIHMEFHIFFCFLFLKSINFLAEREGGKCIVLEQKIRPPALSPWLQGGIEHELLVMATFWVFEWFGPIYFYFLGFQQHLALVDTFYICKYRIG